MAVDVKTSGFRFEAGTDIPVFDSRTSAFGFMFYDVSKDGAFLIPAKTGQGGTQQFKIVVNGTAGLNK
jgi:hypothetical protein